MAGRAADLLPRELSLRRAPGAAWPALLALAAAAGIVTRVVLYRSNLGAEDSDEAVLGLMVRHAEHGHLTAFLWGQAYGGIQEVLLAVPVFWLFGPSVAALRGVPIALDLVTVYLVWRAGRRLLGERRALVAAAVSWLWPAVSVFEHMHEWGFYASGALYAVVLLLLALRAQEEPSRLRLALFGLVAGLGFYQTFQIVPIVVPLAAWLTWRQRAALRLAAYAAVPAVLAALPFLVWNAAHGWASLHLEPGASFSYSHRLRIFFSPVLPEALGLKFIHSERWIVPAPIGALAYVALAAAFAYGAYRARHRDALVLYLVVATYPFLYALSPKANVASDSRYAMVLSPILALLVAQVAARFSAALAVVAAAIVLSAVVLRGADEWNAAHANVEGPTAPRSLAPLVQTLDRLGVRRVFTNYWLAYRLDFDTNERIVAVENGFDRLVVSRGDVLPTRDVVRWRAYDRAVRAGPHAFVFFAHFLPHPAELRLLTSNGYHRRAVDGFFVYWR